MQAAAGMVSQPAGYLTRIRELTEKYKVLLIADEVATGFGRTGKMFACQHEGITPDLMAISKGLTGGYLPLAATLTTAEIYRAFLGRYDEFKAFFHGHSYTGNPLGCAVALANLEVFRREKTLTRLPLKIRALARGLTLIRALPHVGDIRQRGLMAGIELVRDGKTKQPYPLGARAGHRVAAAARANGLILRPIGNVLVLLPPLSVSTNELRRIITILQNSIATLAKE
jgi:adenosylmethionine-8-amino-7-oxononanoate aminotransferase